MVISGLSFTEGALLNFPYVLNSWKYLLSFLCDHSGDSLFFPPDNSLVICTARNETNQIPKLHIVSCTCTY